MTATLPLNEDRIRAVAYSLWLDEGQPHGRAESHWLRALDLVASEAEPAAKPKAKRAAPRKAPAATKPAAPRKRAPSKD